MKVRGFIVEDNQGREFVLVCEQLSDRSAKTFALRGWQRRRLVPLQYTEEEHRQIVAQVLVTLDDLFKSLPRLYEDVESTGIDKAATAMEDEGDRVMN